MMMISKFKISNELNGWMLIVQRDIEAEMRRLKIELKQTMDMYSSACKEALNAKKKVRKQVWDRS